MSLLSPASVMSLICFYHLCEADTQKDRGAVTAAAPSRSCGQGHLCGVGGDAQGGDAQTVAGDRLGSLGPSLR